jgi:hypothetical protein
MNSCMRGTRGHHSSVQYDMNRTTMNRSAAIIAPLFIYSFALAGPPFRTDDPQPVDYLHWELYVASAQQFQHSGSSATCPHIEINYGLIPNVQIHCIAPLEYVHTTGGTLYGYSDTELGLKYRFVEETETTPQIGTFPLIEIPTGNEHAQLGNGTMQAYLPVWIQKSWGGLTTYGGGGMWINPGIDQKNWIYAGWEIQYDFSSAVTFGSELYYQTAQTQNSGSSTGYTLGGTVNLQEHHHILFSVGHSMSGESLWNGYIAYQLTI